MGTIMMEQIIFVQIFAQMQWQVITVLNHQISGFHTKNTEQQEMFMLTGTSCVTLLVSPTGSGLCGNSRNISKNTMRNHLRGRIPSFWRSYTKNDAIESLFERLHYRNCLLYELRWTLRKTIHNN